MSSITRRKFTELLALGALAGCTMPPAPKQQPVGWTLYSPDRYGASSDAIIPWRLVAMSDLIVRGTITVSSEAAKMSEQPTVKAFQLPLSVSHVFKGEPTTRLIEISYSPNFLVGPNPYAVAAANGKESVFLLAKVDGENNDANPRYMFTFNSLYRGDEVFPIIPSSTVTAKTLMEELRRQGPLATRVAEYLAAHIPPNDAYAAALVEQLLAEPTAYDASQELLSLGPAYAAALIRHMDDRRPIVLSHFSVPGPEGFWEAIVHWGPRAVVDLISTVLQVRMDYAMPATNNGGAERARRRVVDAWRVWLGRSLRLQAG